MRYAICETCRGLTSIDMFGIDYIKDIDMAALRRY